MAMYGQGATRGKVAILGIDAATNQACAALLLNQELVDSKYIFFYLSSKYDSIRAIGHGGNQINLNSQLIRQISIALPPLVEQRKIAEILSAWDRIIDLTSKRIAAKQEYKHGLLQQLLTGKRRSAEFIRTRATKLSSYGEIPADWIIEPLSSLTQIITRTETIQPNREYRLIGVRWYGEGAHIHDTLFGSQIITPSLSRIESGDIVYNKMWASKAAFAIAKPEHQGAYGTNEYPQFRVNQQKLSIS